MKISVNWLKDYIELPEPVQEISDILTMSGLEVEGLEEYQEVPGSLQGLVLGKVMSCDKHPEADRLVITKVDVGGDQPLSIVCGAPNVATGQTVVVAPVDTTLFPNEGDPFKIKRAKIRGEVSEGMICAEDEVGLGTDHQGIMVLDTDLKPGTPANDYFKIETHQVLEIGLTPNRTDAISHLGVCRDLKAVLDRAVHWPDLDSFQPDSRENPITVKVENTEACPRYSGLSFDNLEIKESPQWLQNKLRSIGLTPINNVVDITNFVNHEMGQPLHAFDADHIAGDTVLVKTLSQGSKFTTLDEKERELNDFDLMICDGEEKGMCIAGVFGGITSGVTDKTTRLFLECAYFSADYIRKTAQFHGLKTDASFRYERGTDPNMTVVALKRAAMLIQELAGGRIVSDLIDIYPNKVDPVQVRVTYKNVDRLIGKSIEPDQIQSILTNLDFQLKDADQKGFVAVVPTYRTEVTREADVIEEILRIYGYNNIELLPHYGSKYLAEFPSQDTDKARFGLSKMLAAQGFWEIYTNSLTKPLYTEENPEYDAQENVEILNKLSEDLGVLRQTLLFTGLESIAYNLNHRQNNLRFFEFGNVYRLNSDRKEGLAKYHEQPRLSLFMTGDNQEESWMDQTRPLEFHDLSAVINKTLDKFNISAYNSRVIQNGVFEFGLEITMSGLSLIQYGKLTPEVCAQADIKQSVFYADINWEELVQMPKDDVEYVEVARFPEVRRDLSLVLDKGVQFSEVAALAYQTEKNILKRINVFDLYQGDKIDSNKKAYALSFILQDKTKTLTDKIIDKCMSRLMQNFEQQLGAIIRK